MYRLIKTSSDNKQLLKDIGKKLVNLDLSPCVQISSKTESIYKWHDNVELSSEYILTIKTLKKYSDKCFNLIKKHHNYEVPEIIELEFSILNDKYIRWFNENL